MSSSTRGAMRMTEGPVTRQLIAFAFPLLLGNLFQQLYNSADSLIVGNLLGSEALAAVSSSGHLIFLMIGLFNGISIGAGVVISHHFGAKMADRLSDAIHTLLLFGLLCGAALTVLGMCAAPMLLRLMGTPADVFPLSVRYFQTYFLGSVGFVLYNLCMCTLQAVGDSRHPLYYLIISSVINIFLDWFFIAVMHFGVASAAAATVIAQFFSALLSLRLLTRVDDIYRVDLRRLRLNRSALRAILQNGLPTGLQNSINSIGNVVVQANINAFGAAAIAGIGSSSRIEGFCFLPVICFSSALTTFVSQNLGAGQKKRVLQGIAVGVPMTMILSQLIAWSVYAFSPKLIGLFSSDPSVIACGVLHQHITMPFFFLPAGTHALSAVCRGSGHAVVPMMVMLGVWCCLRIVYVTVAVRFFPMLQTVSWAYPITWAVSTLVLTVYFFRSGWLKRSKVS